MNIAKMMQQAKAMQDKMETMQADLANVTVDGASGGGMVKITMTCKGQCQALVLDPSIVKADEKDILEDLIKAAINDAKGKADARMAEETQKMMADLGLPAGVKLPF